MSVADDIKSRLDILEVVSGYVPLKKAGRTYKALCPFHTEKTPSFVVFPESGTWRCFGACQTGGDVFTFVQKQANLDFAEALELLAERAGVELQPRSRETSDQEQQKEGGRAILAAAAAYYHHLLKTSPQAKNARAYFAQRGVSDEIIEQFGLGYASSDWDAAKRALVDEGYKIADLEAVGLLSKRQSGDDTFDRFRSRLMIPIRDIKGLVVGFGARSLEAEQQPKYLNSPQTTLFDKSHLLFGIDAAKHAIRENDLAVIVEGYMDVLAAHQHGYHNVVASMGTALTEAQLRQLTRYSHKVVLALDADEAGVQATLRGIEVTRETSEREAVPVHSPRGLLRFEEQLKTELSILSLPTGQDPDDVLRADPTRWHSLVAGAQPLVDFYFSLVTEELDLESARGKADAVQRLAPLVREVADPVAQAHYVRRLALLTQTSERIIEDGIAQSPKGGRHRRRGPQQQTPPSSQTATPFTPIVREEYILALLLRAQMPLSRLQGALHILEMSELESDDFSEGEYRAIFQTLDGVMLDNGDETEGSGLVESIRGHLSATVHPHLDHLTQLSERLPPVSDEAATKDLVDTVLRLRMDDLERSLSGLRYLLEDAREGQESEAIDQYSQLIRKKSAERDRLEKALYARTYVGRRQAPVGVM